MAASVIHRESGLITTEHPGELVDINGNPISSGKTLASAIERVQRKAVESRPKKAPVKPVTTLRDVPPNTLFRHRKSGTIYMKMPDGSIRNMDKAARRSALSKGLTRKQKRTKI